MLPCLLQPDERRSERSEGCSSIFSTTFLAQNWSETKCFITFRRSASWAITFWTTGTCLKERSPSLPSMIGRTCSLPMKHLMFSDSPRYYQPFCLTFDRWTVSRITCFYPGGKVQCVQEHGLHDAHGKHDQGFCARGQRGTGWDQGIISRPLSIHPYTYSIHHGATSITLIFIFDRTKTIR